MVRRMDTQLSVQCRQESFRSQSRLDYFSFALDEPTPFGPVSWYVGETLVGRRRMEDGSEVYHGARVPKKLGRLAIAKRMGWAKRTEYA